jgi:cytochrome c
MALEATAKAGKRCLGGAGLVVLALLTACGPGDVERAAIAQTGGDPERGRAAIRRFGCQACHSVPGVRGPRGQVGPPLDGIGGRSFLAGQLPNTPTNMIRWIRAPQAVERGTAMPNLGVTEPEARDIAAYLYTLR